MPTYYGTDTATVSTLATSGVTSVVFNADSTLIYAAAGGFINVYSVSTGALISSWNSGAALAALSLSQDGSFLLATLTDTFNSILRISTVNGAVQSYTSPSSGAFNDVEIVDGQTAILTGTTPMKFDLATGVFTALPNAVYYSGGGSVLVEDNHLTLVAEPGISNGPLAIYDDRTGTIVARGDDYQSGAASGFNWGHQAISEAAGQVAQFIYYSSINIYDLSLHAIRNVPISGRVDGLSYSADGKFLFAHLIDSGYLAKYSTSDFTLVDQYYVGTSQWHNNAGYGDQIHVTADGAYVTVADNSSVKALQLVHLIPRDDFFAGTAGADTFYGLGGNDTYIVNDLGDRVFEDVGKGIDTVQSSVDWMLGPNLENLTLTGSNPLTGTGNALDNVIIGNAAASTLLGGAGNDRLVVGTGANGTTIDGGAGTDTLVVTGAVSLGGLTGIEAIELPAGGALTLTGAQFSGGLAPNATLSGTGSLTINMGAGDSELYLQQLVSAGGSSVAITVNGSANGDVIKGVLGLANTINGGDGNDSIRGGQRADTINGGNGNDKIEGGQGADILTGGAGADVFRYQSANASGIGVAADRIADFVSGTDKLGFLLLDSDPVAPGQQGFSYIDTQAFHGTGAAEVRYGTSGADLLVQLDLNGDAVADMEILLQGLGGQSLASGDFLLNPAAGAQTIFVDSQQSGAFDFVALPPAVIGENGYADTMAFARFDRASGEFVGETHGNDRADFAISHLFFENQLPTGSEFML